MSSILFYSTRKSKFSRKKFSKKLHIQKNGPSGAPGPASASPWRAERGTLPKLSSFLSQLKGFVAKHQKIEAGKIFYFRDKISQCRKKLKGGPFGEKNFRKKSLAVPKKKLEGGPFGLAGYGMLRRKTGKSFLVQFARPHSAIWCNNIS